MCAHNDDDHYNFWHGQNQSGFLWDLWWGDTRSYSGVIWYFEKLLIKLLCVPLLYIYKEESQSFFCSIKTNSWMQMSRKACCLYAYVFVQCVSLFLDKVASWQSHDGIMLSINICFTFLSYFTRNTQSRRLSENIKTSMYLYSFILSRMSSDNYY